MVEARIGRDDAPRAQGPLRRALQASDMGRRVEAQRDVVRVTTETETNPGALYGKYEPWARTQAAMFVRRIPQARHLTQDVYQAAYLGLWQAARAYDPSKGFFGAFALAHIRGQMKQLCQTWNVAFVNRAARKATHFEHLSDFCWSKRCARPISTEIVLRRLVDDVEEHATHRREGKYTDDQARAMTRLYASQNFTLEQIGTWFGLDKRGVHSVVARAIRRAREDWIAA